jgi:hypothetical protein
MTHSGRREKDHAPLFAKPPVVGSAWHRLPAKYLGWSGCARFRGFLGSARAPDSEDFRSAQRAAGHFCGSLYSQSGGIRLPKIAGAVTGRPGPPCPDDAPREGRCSTWDDATSSRFSAAGRCHGRWRGARNKPAAVQQVLDDREPLLHVRAVRPVSALRHDPPGHSPSWEPQA